VKQRSGAKRRRKSERKAGGNSDRLHHPQRENELQVEFDLGKDPATGKRQLRFVTIRGNRRDAERELARLLNEVNNNLFVDPDKVTMANSWIAGYATTQPRTLPPRRCSATLGD